MSPSKKRVLFLTGAQPVGAFIPEQMASMAALGFECELMTVKSSGLLGYLRELPSLRAIIRQKNIHLIHAHYGLSGTLACMQFIVPVVTTFHGSDVFRPWHRWISYWARWRSRRCIYVAEKMFSLVSKRPKDTLLPCGIDRRVFMPLSRLTARKDLGWDLDEQVVLFSGPFSRVVKNPQLAKSVVAQSAKLSGKPIRLQEMYGFDREGVARAMNASDALLMTSDWEGSPQVVKEALACRLPVVSVPVGDVPYLLEGIEGCEVADRSVEDLSEALKRILASNERLEKVPDGRILSLEEVAARIQELYQQALKA